MFVGAFGMTQQVTNSFKQVAILTGLTMLVGGAEISSAATLVQDPSFGPLSGPGPSSTTLNLNQFDPALGTLTSVEVKLTSQVFESIGTTVSGSATGQGFSANFGPFALGVSPFTLNITASIPGSPFVDPFVGLGTLPYGFQYSAACGEGPIQLPFCGEGWGGDLKVTYTYDPVPQVPLPAALPLFATGLAGLGAMGWVRRLKRKAKKQA
jgi:hypothetical protein